MKKNIALVAGGNSSEYIVSLNSAKNVALALNSDKYSVFIVRVQDTQWTIENEDTPAIEVNKNDFSFQYKSEVIHFDAAYIIIHGTPGEDGLLQGYFDLIGLPYSTGSVLNMSLTFNKYRCNNYLRGQNINVADSFLLRSTDNINPSEIINKVGLPCFVKPNDAGSSFGVSKVKMIEELSPAIEKAFNEGKEVIIERFLNGTEVTCGVVKTKHNEVVLPITEIVSQNEFFDYAAKYTASLVEEITPARISIELTQKVQSITSQVYDLLDCKGIVRVDFIIQNNIPYVLEINTIPGMSAESIIPKQLKAANIQETEVLDWVINDLVQ